MTLDAEEKTSDWDVYVGMTPFDDMAGLVEAGAIEPWNDHVPPSVLDDIEPAIRRECTLDGKLYGWPFLLDVTVQGWNAELVERGDLDPACLRRAGTSTRDRTRGATRWGRTVRLHVRRSALAIARSDRLQLLDGRLHGRRALRLQHAAVVEALEVLRRMFKLANPDALDPYTTAGAAATTDEAAFASQLAAYYVKYANAHIRAANTWPDPSRSRSPRCPWQPMRGRRCSGRRAWRCPRTAATPREVPNMPKR